MSDKIDHEAFFKRYGDYFIKARYYDCDNNIDVEDLYQIFKARLMQELNVQNSEVKK